MTHFWRPVKKTRPQDSMWTARPRFPRIAVKPVSLGNKPANAYFTAVSHEFVILDQDVRRRNGR